MLWLWWWWWWQWWCLGWLWGWGCNQLHIKTQPPRFLLRLLMRSCSCCCCWQRGVAAGSKESGSGTGVGARRGQGQYWSPPEATAVSYSSTKRFICDSFSCRYWNLRLSSWNFRSFLFSWYSFTIWFLMAYKIKAFIMFWTFFLNIKVKVSHNRPRWLKGFRVG